MSLLKSRFIEMFIEKRYPTASLDELSICGGEYGAQSSAIEYHPNRPRYVRITDINEDGSLNNDYASSANIKDDEQYRLKYGDFLFARMGATVGKTYAYTFGDQIYAGYLIRYRLNLEKILPEYLFAFTRLNCYWKWVSINQNGAAQPGINAKKYGSLYVPVPPIEEQKKFIELSQQIDKSKFLLQQIIKKLELLKKSRFIEMFGDPIKNEKRWAQLTLNSVCDGIGDGLHGTPEYDDSGDFYFINGNNLINGEIVITPSTKKVNEEVFKKYYRNISSNALLLSINGTLGKIAFYNNEAITLGKSACYINLKTFVNKYFVFELMKTDHFLKYLEENSTKSTIKNVSLKTIRNFQLISPPENLQNDFISFSKKIDKSKLIIQKALEDLVGKV